MKQRGFTLLEMLLVLALMGLLGSLALPAFSRLTDSMRARSERSDVLAQVGTLAYRHYLLAQNSLLDNDNWAKPLKDGKPALDLPPGWSAQIPSPIRFQFNGYCSGGVIILNAPDHSRTVMRLRSPDCGVGNAG